MGLFGFVLLDAVSQPRRRPRKTREMKAQERAELQAKIIAMPLLGFIFLFIFMVTIGIFLSIASIWVGLGWLGFTLFYMIRAATYR